jgi:predicted permease
MSTLLQDLRFALRTLRRSWLVTLLATVSLAAGIAGNTAVFSMIEGVMLRPLPYPEPDRIVMLGERDRETAQGTTPPAMSLANLWEYDTRSRTLEEFTAFRPTVFMLGGGERPTPLTTAQVAVSFFGLTGAAPERGRLPAPEEAVPGGPKVAVLSHAYWERTSAPGEDPLEKVLQLNGEPYQVIGVLREGFEFLVGTIDLWVPLQEAADDARRDRRDVLALARMRPGTTMALVRDDVERVARELEDAYPRANLGYTADAMNLRHDIPDSRSRQLILLLQGSVFFVLLIACANIANLLLARSQQRQREIAIRTILGAGRGRIIRQLLKESLVLVMIGGIVGLWLGWIGIGLLDTAFGAALPRMYAPALNARVVVFTVGVTLLAGVMFGLFPAMTAFGTGHATVLRDGGGRGATEGRGKRRVSRGLVIGEIALSLVALGGGSVMIRSFLALQNADPGFDPANLLTVLLTAPAGKYGDDEQTALVMRRVREHVGDVSGVESVSLVNSLPRNFLAPTDSYRIDGSSAGVTGRVPRVISLRVTPDYLHTLGVRLLAGRFFDENDRMGAPPVAVINRSMADARFDGESPLGRRITIVGESREIVGIASDVRQLLIHQEGTTEEAVYLPLAQEPQRSLYAVVRGGVPVRQIVTPVRAAIAEVDRDIVVSQMLTMDEFIAQFFTGAQVYNVVLGGFGILALLLASVGTYGVLAYSVAQRRQEIGVRLAVGAQPRQVVRMVARQGAVMSGLGLGIGVLLLVPLIFLIDRLLQGLAPIAPMTVVAVAALLFVVTMLASVVPAARAASVDPVDALRAD